MELSPTRLRNEETPHAHRRSTRDASPMPEPHPVDPDKAAWINAHYYEQRPWEHFARRLVAVATAFGQSDQWHALMSSPTTIGPLRVEARAPDTADSQQAHLGQVAIEAVVLLHHAAETLLRLIHAHGPTEADAPLPVCPPIALARMRDFQRFKTWVRTTLIDDQSELTRYIRATLGDDDRDGRLALVGQYVRRIGQQFLDADAYNAAKHGFGVRGEHSRLVVSIEDVTFADVSGAAITWLDDRAVRPVMTTCWYSVEGLLALSHACCQLVEQLWRVAQRRYLGAEREMIWRPQPIADLWSSLGVDDLVLLKMSES